MPLNAYVRLRHHLARHGAGETFSRLVRNLQRRFFQKRYFVYWFDLTQPASAVSLPGGSLSLARIHSAVALPEGFAAAIGQEYPVELVNRDIRKRFDAGAVLWCLHDGRELVGYTWTLAGAAMKEYFFPLTPQDVHIFDNVVMPDYRGRGLNTILMKYMLATLREEGLRRAYAETAEWNAPEQRSFAKIGFLPIGLATRKTWAGHKHVVVWQVPAPAPGRSADELSANTQARCAATSRQ